MEIVRVTVSTDYRKAKNKIDKAIKKALPKVTKELVADANFYCREQTGALKQSALTSSRWNDGIAVWNTPYAKDVYFTGSPATNVNPNASLMWAQRAADENKDKYGRMFEEALK